MDKTYLNDINKVTLVGRLTDSILEEFTTPDGKKFITVQLVVKRISGIEDYVKLTIPSHYKNILPYDDKLMVKGVYRTYNFNGHLIQRVFVQELTVLSSLESDKNEFVFTGTIVSIRPLRKSPFGKIILDMIVAINSNGKTAYTPCIVWGTLARFINNKPVGTRISSTARLQSRAYEKTVGDIKEPRMAYEVSILDLEVLSGK